MDNQSVYTNEGRYNGLDTFCGSTFWDLNVTWHTENPDFTRCFQKTVLVWIPCTLLWMLSPLGFHYIMHSKNRNISWTWLNISKFLITSLLIVITIVDLGNNLDSDLFGKDIFPADYCVPIIRLFSYAFSIVLLQFNLKKGLRSSGLLFLFWLMQVICESIRFRSLLKNTSYGESSGLPTSFILYMIYDPLLVVQLFLNCFADAAPKYLPYPPVKNPCPEIEASFLSRMLFSWYDKLSWKGFRKPLQMQDLWNIRHEDSSVEIVPLFDKYWMQSLKESKVGQEKTSRNIYDRNNPDNGSENTKQQASIFPALFKTFGSSFLFAASLKIIQDVLTFVKPQILSALIEFVDTGDNPWKGYFLAILMFITSLLQTIFLSQYFHRLYLVGMRIRTALVSAIYRKALRLSNAARRVSTVGEIVNLMSVDAQRFMDLTIHLNLLWSAPLQIVLALYFLWQILGPAVLSGLAVMVLLIPFNALIAHYSQNLQIRQMKYKDQRVKLMNEVLSGIKVLKLYAWEPSFEQQILNVRNKELKILKQTAYLDSGSMFVWLCAPFLVSLTSFATFVFTSKDNVLDSKTAFVSISLFNILRFPLAILPFMISNLVEAIVSIKRLNKFMNLEEIDPNNVEHDKYEAISCFFCDLTPRLGCWKAGRNLQCVLLKGVLRAPMTFFDTTPLGRILARFSKDLDVMDSTLPSTVSDILYCAFEGFAILFVICYSTPMFLAVIIPLGIVYYFIQQFYVSTSRQLQRLESVSRSPIFSHFGESISGAPSIRAYRVQNRFIEENETIVDQNQMCYYPSIVANR